MKLYSITLTEIEKQAVVRALDEAIDKRSRFEKASGIASTHLRLMRAVLYKLDTATESEAAT